MPILDWLNREKDVRAAEGVPYRLMEVAHDLVTLTPMKYVDLRIPSQERARMTDLAGAKS